jgi:hypothetical protein
VGEHLAAHGEDLGHRRAGDAVVRHLHGRLDHRQDETLDAESVEAEVAPLGLQQPFAQVRPRDVVAQELLEAVLGAAEERSLCHSVSSASKPVVQAAIPAPLATAARDSGRRVFPCESAPLYLPPADFQPREAADLPMTGQDFTMAKRPTPGPGRGDDPDREGGQDGGVGVKLETRTRRRSRRSTRC